MEHEVIEGPVGDFPSGIVTLSVPLLFLGGVLLVDGLASDVDVVEHPVGQFCVCVEIAEGIRFREVFSRLDELVPGLFDSAGKIDTCVLPGFFGFLASLFLSFHEVFSLFLIDSIPGEVRDILDLHLAVLVLVDPLAELLLGLFHDIFHGGSITTIFLKVAFIFISTLFSFYIAFFVSIVTAEDLSPAADVPCRARASGGVSSDH